MAGDKESETRLAGEKNVIISPERARCVVIRLNSETLLIIFLGGERDETGLYTAGSEARSLPLLFICFEVSRGEIEHY